MRQPPAEANVLESSLPLSKAPTVRLGDEELLPAICPLCAAPGTLPRPIPQPFRFASRPVPVLEGIYCDICAKDLQDQQTRRLALLSATTIFAMSAVTAAALFWGTRQLFLQISLGVMISIGLPALLYRWGVYPRLDFGVEPLCADENSRLVRVTSETFAKKIHSEGLLQLVVEPRVGSPPFPTRWFAPALSVFFCCAWWLAIHSLGKTQIRVIKSGHLNGFLLIDERNEGQIIATNSESPEAGRFISILGGRHTVRLVSDNGRTDVETPLLVWPNKSYIVGTLPTGKCLYLETQQSGEEGSSHLWIPLRGSGPVWELEERVDSWFTELGSPTNEEGSESALATSGGTRRSVRLLPCR